MTRWALGLSVGWMITTTLAPVAAASSTDGVCDCGPVETVLPAPGAIDLPRNTKIWVVGQRYGKLDVRTDNGMSATLDPVEARGDGGGFTRYDLHDLDAHQEYVAEVTYGPRTRFTTGADLDLAPPAPPQIRALGIAVTPIPDSNHDGIADLTLDAGFDPDVALVRIELTGPGVPALSFTTTPGGWRTLGRPACYSQLGVHPGDHVQVAVIAIDIAGNESEPTIQTITVAPGTAELGPCARHRHFECGTGMIGVLLIGVIFVIAAFGVVIALVINHFSRRAALRRAAPEPLSPLAGEHLVRRSQVRAGLVAVLGIVGVPVFFLRFDGVAILPILSTLIGCVGIRGFFVARAALAMIETGKAEVESLGPRVVVRIGDAETHIDLTQGKIAAARRKYSVPMSIAKR